MFLISRRELQYMLHLGYKAEIQVLASVDSKKQIQRTPPPTEVDNEGIREAEMVMENAPPGLSTLFKYVSEKIIQRLQEKERMGEAEGS